MSSNLSVQNPHGAFIVFEGLDGCGKDTQVTLLADRLRQEKGIEAYTTNEPTANPTGKLIREMLIRGIPAGEESIAGAYVADRLDHVANPVYGLKRYYDEGRVIISARYVMSSYAYNVAGENITLEWVINANRLSTDILSPNVTFFLDITPEVGLSRVLKRNSAVERFENLERLRRVYANYQRAIEVTGEANHVFILDGSQSSDIVHEQVWGYLLSRGLV